MATTEHEAHAFTREQRVYFWLASVNVTALLLANIVGVKLFRFELDMGSFVVPVEHTVGMLPFPITFLLTDLVNEYYGRRAARRIAYVAFTMAALAWLLLWAARAMPILEGIPGTATQAAFENVFGAASLMYLASIAAFLVGNLIDIFLFGWFKRATGGRMVWLRATGSTVVSQLFDSLLVTMLFFQVLQRAVGQECPDLGWTLRTAFTGYVLKFAIALALTPAVYLGRWLLRAAFGLAPLPADET
ncbi:MAG: hypothetical protein RL148_885 [Planctomycetota bacterium]